MIRELVVKNVVEATGVHDEPEIYGGSPDDLGLCGGPESMSWRLHGAVGTIAAAGLAAIVMEILHPSVVAGVESQSSYRTQTFRRARNTFGYVVITTFGNTPAAERVIARVRRIHEHVNGTRPDGVEYRALDPELIGWVHTAIPWAMIAAYERYRGPLTDAEKARYLSEQAVIGRLGGATDIPETAAELDAYVEAMRPKLAVSEQTTSFIGFLVDGPEGTSAAGRLQNRLALHAGMSLMPAWARQLTATAHPDLVQQLWVHPSTWAQVRLIDWAFGVPDYRRLAEERVAVSSSSRRATSKYPRTVAI